MKKSLLLAFATMLFASASFSQCAPAMAMDTLNINQVNALMLNGGDLWGSYAKQAAYYVVPKGTGLMTQFRGALWIGGYDYAGNLHGAMQEYRQGGNDFWPGPLDTISASIDSVNCGLYDKIWKVNRDKVEDFKYYWAHGNVQNGTYTPDPSILNWPGNENTSHGFSHKLAPYVDVNHNGVYDPLTGGDYPKMMGDQMLWWVMNDKGNIHSQTQCSPLGIEIHATAYAFTCPQIADSEKVINYTTLYHYEIFNRSTFAYDSVYVALWQDGDLGCATDDHVGCYPAGNYSYYYNEDSIDVSCGSELGYGADPPISSTVILGGKQMAHFAYFTNGGAQGYGDPAICKEYYDYMTGSWANGNPWMYGGWGYPPTSSTTPTPFCFPDFPYITSGWHDPLPYGDTVSDDRRDMTSCGPYKLLPGAIDTFDFAVVYTRDTTLPFMGKAIFDKNMHDNQRIQRWFANNSFPSCLQLNTRVNEQNNMANNFTIYPNPTSGEFQVSSDKYQISSIEIYNVYGEKVYEKLSITNSPLSLNLSEAKNGIYFLQLKTNEGIAVKKLVISK